MEAFSAAELLAMSPGLREACNRVVECVHPDDSSIAGVSHVMWTGAPQDPGAHGRNAVFYGSGALDRSPCGNRQLRAHGAVGGYGKAGARR